MNFSIDLFLDQMAVPFVPTLGVVHPRALAASVAGIMDFSHDGGFLPYDKEKRWGGEKRERLLKELIFQDNSHTVIPTYQAGTSPLIRLYSYGTASVSEGLQDQLQKLHPQAKMQVVSFGTGGEFKPDSIVFLYELDTPTSTTKTSVVSFKTLSPEVARTIGFLAENDPDNGGFSFLKERLAQGHDDGDIFVTTENGAISGAVGPLRTMTDAEGWVTRYPVYYGVSMQFRRKGYGSALWSSAIGWAHKNGVQYIVLQARTNSPAEYFYRQVGLTSLGGVSRRSILSINL